MSGAPAVSNGEMTSVDVRMHGDIEVTSDLSGTATTHGCDRSGRRGHVERRWNESDAERGGAGAYDMPEGVSARIANDGSMTIQVFISLPSFPCRRSRPRYAGARARSRRQRRSTQDDTPPSVERVMLGRPPKREPSPRHRIR